MVYEVSRKYTVGEIELESGVLTEVNITSAKNMPIFPHAKKCTVEVMGDEGKYIPHFHINNKDGVSVCIYIYENKYFTHGVHDGTLSSRDCKALDKWLREKNSVDKSMSNWKRITQLWDTANGKSYIDSPNVIVVDEQPDYTTIRPYKE